MRRLLKLSVVWSTLLALGIAAALVVADDSASSGRVAVAPTADSYVSRAQPGKNFGSAKHLTARPPGSGRVYLRFDVPKLSGTWSARLRVFRLGSSPALVAMRVGRRWDERTISWRNAPALGSRTLGRASPGARGFTELPLATKIEAGRLDLVVVVSCQACDGPIGSREAARRSPRLVLTRAPKQTTTTSTPTESGSSSPSTSTETTPETNTTATTTTTSTSTGADPPPGPGLDTTAPLVTIDAPSNGATVGPSPTLSGTAGSASGDSAAITVRIYSGGSATGTPTATLHPTASGGAWSAPAGTLSGGTYTAQAEQDDASANKGFSGAVTFTVDATPPDTQITGGPTGTVSDSSPSFTFSSADSGATFQCRLDGPGGAGTFATCGSPKQYSNLVDGSYVVNVRAVDAVGNVDATPSTRSFTVDTTPPPVPSITSPANGTVTNDPSFDVTGTAGAGNVIDVLDGGSSLGTTTANGSG
ncbi:MAG: large repetitive protein, partial [Thermoleophilaceae bacterium]|nr:large repetitive protein [Thermoleophilaceae bacterium]